MSDTDTAANWWVDGDPKPPASGELISLVEKIATGFFPSEGERPSFKEPSSRPQSGHSIVVG